jgi:hypothetical protein
MFASELLWQVVEESKAARVLFFSLAPLESSSNVCFPDWMLSSCCPSQTSSFCVLSKTATILDLHKLHTVTRTAEEGEFYDMENMHTHNNPTATLNKSPHPKTRKEKQKSFSKLYKLQFLVTMETWE